MAQNNVNITQDYHNYRILDGESPNSLSTMNLNEFVLYAKDIHNMEEEGAETVFHFASDSQDSNPDELTMAEFGTAYNTIMDEDPIETGYHCVSCDPEEMDEPIGSAVIIDMNGKLEAEGLPGIEQADTGALRFLTEDIDGTMHPKVVQRMVDHGYLQNLDGDLTTTDRGQDLLNFVDERSNGFDSQHVAGHIRDFENSNPISTMNMKLEAEGFTGITTADDGAVRFLTEDKDGRMHPRVVQQMVDNGYLKNSNGALTTTEKGQALLDHIDSSTGGFNAQHVAHHVQDFELAHIKDIGETVETYAGFTSFESIDEAAWPILLGGNSGQLPGTSVVVESILDGSMEVQNGVLVTTSRGFEYLAMMERNGVETRELRDVETRTLLLEDRDGMVGVESIEVLINREYVSVTNGIMAITDKGRDLMDSIRAQGSTGQKQVLEYVYFYEAGL